MPSADNTGRVEVVYALPDEQHVVAVELMDGLTARGAVEASGLVARFPEIAATGLVLGIYGEEVSLDRVLHAGDRLEITRPLKADPRARRRELVIGGKVMTGATAPQRGVRRRGPA